MSRLLHVVGHAMAAVLACVLVQGTNLALAAEHSTPSTTTPTTTLAPGRALTGSEQDACRVLPTIASGKLAGSKPLATQQDPAFREAVTNYVSCLTVAKKDRRYCQLLSKAEQNGCLVWSKAVDKLKGPTGGKLEGAALAPLLDYECRRLTDKKAVCDQLQNAIVTKNVAKCQGLPEPFGTNCQAIVTGDAAHCGDDANCKKLVEDLKTTKGTGASPSKDAPSQSLLATLVAAANGNERACEPLLEALQNACGRAPN